MARRQCTAHGLGDDGGIAGAPLHMEERVATIRPHPVYMRHPALPSLWALTAIAFATGLSVLVSSQETLEPLRSDSIGGQVLCGTRTDEGLRGLRLQPTQVADGEPLSFEQDPPLLSP